MKQLNLGGPHDHPSVSDSGIAWGPDRATRVVREIFGDWDDEVPEAVEIVRKALAEERAEAIANSSRKTLDT